MLQISPHTHILTARSPDPYSPTTPLLAHSPTAFSVSIVRPSPSPAHAPGSHPQAGPPDSAASPVIGLSRVLCASLRVLDLPPSPARDPCSHPQTGLPDSAISPVIVLYLRALCARLCVLDLPPSPAGFRIWVSTSSSPRIHWHTSPRTRSPSSLHPPFTHYSFSPRSLVCGGQTSPQKPLLVVSHSTCSPRSSSHHANNFVLGTAVINNTASVYCTRAQTLRLDSYSRTTAGKSSSPAGLSTLVYTYVVDRAPASPYIYASSTHRFPDERTTIETTPLSATKKQIITTVTGPGEIQVSDVERNQGKQGATLCKSTGFLTGPSPALGGLQIP